VSVGESEERAERRARQRELADRLKASGALDGIFEQIDAGEVPLSGDEGLLKGILKAALGRCLDVELTDHVGYERGDPNASLFANSRNGSKPKIVSSEIGDLDLAVPRDRNSTFAPQLVPKGSRRLVGLDEMIISPYAGGTTLRDISHHLVSTIGTELSHEAISKITDQVAEEVLVWQRPLEALYPVIYLDALVVKVKDAAHVRKKAAHIAAAVALFARTGEQKSEAKRG
jgi:putative transposase